MSDEICAKCNTKIVRKTGKGFVKCCKCLRFFHTYCVDYPLNSNASNWACYDCNKSVEVNNSNNNGISDESNIKCIISDIMNDVKWLKVKQNEFSKVIDDFATKNNEISAIMDTVSNKMDAFLLLEEKVNKIDNRVELLEIKNHHLMSENKNLTDRINNIEGHAYRTNIEIRNLPHSKTENLFLIFKTICSLIQFDVSSENIKYIHRTYSKAKMKPVVVEFADKFIRDNFMLACKICNYKIKYVDLGLSSLETNSQNSQNAVFPNSHTTVNMDINNSNNNDQPKYSLNIDFISIYEHLSSWKKHLLYEANKSLKQINFMYVWPKHNKIYCKLNENSTTEVINSLDDILKIVQKYKSQ